MSVVTRPPLPPHPQPRAATCVMTRILAGSRGWLVDADRPQDSDRAGGALQDATADRPKHKADEPATSARSHDKQAGAMGLAEELGDRVGSDDVAADRNIGVVLRPAGQRLRDQGLLLAGDLSPVTGPWLVQAEALHWYPPPGVDGGEASPRRCSVSESIAQRGLGGFGAVHSHHDVS